MTQTEINQVVEAMQLSPKYKNILRKCLNGDNEEVKNAIKKLNDANIELNTKLSELANKVNNLKTDVFAVVNSLPTENIENKIYCVKDTTDGGTNNKFIEYIYIETTKSWEKVGEFKAEPDLSGYARLSGAAFENYVVVDGSFDANIASINYIHINPNDEYLHLLTEITEDVSPTKTYTTDGNLAEIGQEESFVFTLEDGSKVTKSIRVVSTTNSQAGA